MENHTPEERVKEWLELFKGPQNQDLPRSCMENVELVSCSAEGPHPKVVFSYTVDPRHCNIMSNLHGGIAATLFDICTSLALTLVARPGFWERIGVSRNLSVNYIRPAPLGAEILIEGEIVHVGKKLAALRGVMKRRSDGAVLSTCTHDKANSDPDTSKL
ncbi:putative thioesterase family protein [Stachybotrys elegans]|uniref:Thioesterase family protein n=1 Tax=Stachybotrys elegans TaxID=80388 RepID=A0A8K0T5A0_9HYPO|nr:putative thioesterase family protein [Stachybotrys elegans]